MLGNQRGGFIFADPLPPLGTVLVASQFPVSLSPEAVLAYVAACPDPGGRPPQTGRIVRFEELKKIETSGSKVIVNGSFFLKTSSSAFATWLAERLRLLSKAKPKTRENMIREMFEESLDVKTIERRWLDFQTQTRVLRILTNAVLGYLFVFAPLLMWQSGLSKIWIHLLAGLFTLTFLTAMLFRRVHKAFYAAAEDERFTHFLTILLSPATTIRARDVLSRPLMQAFHPVAVGRVLCSEAVFRDMARRTWLDVQHPALPICPSDDPAVQDLERTSRALWQKSLEQFLRKNGLDLNKLTAPPLATDVTCRSFCPRCLAQFTPESGQCGDCGGIPLVAFPVPECPP
jgi:hypothetical protein